VNQPGKEVQGSGSKAFEKEHPGISLVLKDLMDEKASVLKQL